MMTYTLFHVGPYAVCFWNILIFAALIFISITLRKVIQRSLKRYLMEANIKVEGRRATWLRLLSLSTYIFTFYVALLSFNINNEPISFEDFLKYKLIDSTKFTLSFFHIILVLACFFGAKIAVNLVKLYFSRKFQKRIDYNPSTEFVYVQISKYIIYVFTIFTCLNVLDVDLKIFLGGSAAILVGLGLGLQDVFKDLFSGIVLLFEGSIKIGDVVELHDSKFKEPLVAKILKINVRTTQIETRFGNVLIIPNTKLTQEYVENWNHGNDVTRFIIDVKVLYGSDTELVTKLLKQAAMSHPKVRKSDPIMVRLKNFGPNALEMELLFWADQSWEASNYKSEIRFEIDRLFRQHNIVFPYSQLDVHINTKQEK